MQTTDSRPLHHHFPAFDVSLHSGSGDEQERGGSGREEAMKRRRKSRQRYEKHRTQREGRFDGTTVYATWKLLAEEW